MSWTHPWADFVVDTEAARIRRVVVPAAPDDPGALRGMFAQHPTGIAAICAQRDGAPHGMIATSFSVGASFEPPLVLFSAQRSSRSWPRIAESAHVGVSVLAEANTPTVARLASRSGERFAGVEIAVSDAGAVFVVGARLWLECRVVSQQELGDHTLVVLEVVGASSSADASPLVYHDGQTVVVGVADAR